MYNFKKANETGNLDRLILKAELNDNKKSLEIKDNEVTTQRKIRTLKQQAENAVKEIESLSKPAQREIYDSVNTSEADFIRSAIQVSLKFESLINKGKLTMSQQFENYLIEMFMSMALDYEGYMCDQFDYAIDSVTSALRKEIEESNND